MSGPGPIDRKHSDKDAVQQAKHGLEQAEAGDQAGTEQLDQSRNSDPPAEQAAEQEAADGPEGRGLSR